MQNNYTDAERDEFYTAMCSAVDEAGPSDETAFPSRLNMLLRQALGNGATARQWIAAALATQVKEPA